MPVVQLPGNYKPIVSEFRRTQKQLRLSLEGKQLAVDVKDFARDTRLDTGMRFDPVKETGAQMLADWVMRMPVELAGADDVPLIDLRALEPAAAIRAISDALQVLGAGASALLGGVRTDPKLMGGALLQVAFGADPVSAELRKPFLDRKFHWDIPLPDWADKLPDIDKLVREGSLREVITTFARCGLAAQEDAAWVAGVVPIGRIIGLSEKRACAGDKLTILFEGFGASPPAGIADVLISVPTEGGYCEHISMSSLVPDLLGGGWRDGRKITIVLPKKVQTGCIGFFVQPEPMKDSACGAGDLVSAAGMMQSILGDQFGGRGVLIGQSLVDLATRVEAGRHRPLPCAACQGDMANHLHAGPPQILSFGVTETGPIYPREMVTLHWSVANADRIEIVARDVPGSEDRHELPAIGQITQAHGQMQVDIQCTRRWQGEYVLQVSNDNGCATAPVERSVRLTSGFSHYKIGLSKVDITDSRAGLGMAGFAYKLQKTSGAVDLAQQARAFVIEENSAAPNRKRLAIVVADLWICSQAVKKAVLEQVNRAFGTPRYTDATLLITGTHTHAGAGGYSDYALYNLMPGGFERQVFERIVNGITSAVINAHASTRRGRIYISQGDLEDCGGQRSRAACARNPEYSPTDQATWTDREMLLLRFDEDIDSAPYHRPVGLLNWFALHPTSLGMFNDEVSGDNKGWAARLVETDPARPPLIAAFANGAAGDVSGNVEFDRAGGVAFHKPLAKPNDRAAVARDKARMMMLARRQADHALMLFDAAGQELIGGLGAVHAFTDMSSITIAGPGGKRTWPAALGISFGAGSSEDSIAYATITDLWSLDIDANILEGIDDVLATQGISRAINILRFSAMPIAAGLLALLTSPPGAVVLTPLLAAGGLLLIVTLKDDLARSFLASWIASLSFEGELNGQKPKDATGEWRWIVPAPETLPAAERAGHWPKPIMFAVGSARLVSPSAGGASVPAPLVPNINPIQLLRIGPLAIAAVPAEFTAQAGRRLKQSVLTALGATATKVVVAGYSNGYSGYVTTEEEYGAQHYEGASTLYGPHTLAAYQQEYARLAVALNAGVQPAGVLPFVMPAVYEKT